MADPPNLDEYNKKFKLNELITGYGLNTTMHMPCPFCGAPNWMSVRILETEKAMAKGATCVECGRSAKSMFDRTNSSVAFEIVQTGGPDQPEWLHPKMRRVTES